MITTDSQEYNRKRKRAAYCPFCCPYYDCFPLFTFNVNLTDLTNLTNLINRTNVLSIFQDFLPNL